MEPTQAGNASHRGTVMGAFGVGGPHLKLPVRRHVIANWRGGVRATIVSTCDPFEW